MSPVDVERRVLFAEMCRPHDTATHVEGHELTGVGVARLCFSWSGSADLGSGATEAQVVSDADGLVRAGLLAYPC